MSGRLGETVTELTARIKQSLETGFPDVLVLGEIGTLRRAASGHVYLNLKDEGATISGVIWRSTAARIRFDLEEGMSVLARGRINLYPPRGQYQLDIRDVRPEGVGALRAAFERLRARLDAEGLFDPARKRPLPPVPRRIGVVTSPVGAALQDILKVLRRRFPHVTVVVHPVPVQGDEAAGRIADAIRVLNERGGFDLLIVGRGGGSLEDLWAFNEEPVARAIAASAIPVISAVGHEVDVTIADLVADVRAPTPSAAAELATPVATELRRSLALLAARAAGAAGSALERRRERLERLSGAYGLRRFPDRLRETAQRLDELRAGCDRRLDELLAARRERLADLGGRAEALSPLRTLARGYSVTTVEGRGAPLRDADEVGAGARILTRLHRGTIRSCVEAVEREEDRDGG